MRLVVTGSRLGHRRLWYWLDRFVARWGVPELVILGGARGVDTQAEAWCVARGVDKQVEYALWETLPPWLAGGERNQRMVDLAAPGDWCLAFPDPKSRGTWDCVGRARAKGLRVVVLPWAA